MLNSLKYRPDIDGLRAVAVLSVLFYHLGMVVPGGYVGVDIFFVISGYLITTIILNSISNNSFSFLDFMARRIRRIYPPMLLVIALTLLIAYQLQLPVDFEQTALSAIAQIFSIANIFFYVEIGGYFRGEVEVIPLLHTWSLSVEEQFYLIVPLMLLGLFKFKRDWVKPIFCAGVIGSLTLSIIGLQYFKTATFYMLPMRAWELGLGALLPIFSMHTMRSSFKIVDEIISLLGLTAIAYTIFMYDSETPFPGQYAVLPCVGTAAIIWANQSRQTLVYKVLSTKPLVAIGLISYSVYLWHWPIIAFSNYIFIDLEDYKTSGLIAISSILFGYLSWRFIERPFRVSSHLQRNIVYKYWAFSSLVIVLISGLIVTQNGFSKRFPAEVLLLAGDSNTKEPGVRVTLQQTKLNEYHPIGISNSREPVEVFLWGDSHAQSILGSFDQYLISKGIRGEAAVYPGVLPILNAEAIYPGSLGQQALDWNLNILNYLQQKQINNVVLVAAWNRNLRDNPKPSVVSTGLQQVVDALNANDINLYIVAQVPENEHSYPRELAMKQWKNGNTIGVGPTRKEYLSTSQYGLFGNISGNFEILTPVDLFYPEGGQHQLASVDNRTLYYDKDHLNRLGSDRLISLFENISFRTH